MRALLLGGTQFVGLRLLRALVDQGHRVTILNRGKTETVLPAGVERLYADRRDPETMRQALLGRLNDFDVIFDITGYQARNLEPVVELFNGRIGHYVFCSTVALYAKSAVYPVEEHFRCCSPLISSDHSYYSAEKVQCEQLLLDAHRRSGFPVTMLRPSIIYGPENWMDDREGSYFARLLLGRKILVGGKGESLIHCGHVDDLARACIAAAASDATIGEAYNVADPHAVTANGMVDIIADIVGVKPQKVYVPYGQIKGSAMMPLEVEQARVFSVQKAKAHFGFWPRFDFLSGMADTYDWWRRHRGLERIVFIPGQLGHDVDLAYEDEAIKKWG